MLMAVQFVLDDFAIQSVSVEAKNPGGLGLIPTGFCERALNELFFKLTQSFFQIYASFDHFRNKGFQLLFHNFSLLESLLLLPPTPYRAVADKKFRFHFVGSQ